MFGIIIRQTTVPTLLELAIRVIIRNLDALAEIGEIPQSIKNRILEHARPDQLKRIEICNIHKNLGTDHIWKSYCIKARYISTEDELEDDYMTWKDFYEQQQNTEKAKLKEIGSRLKSGYVKEKKEKQSKQIQVITPTAASTKRAVGIGVRHKTSRGVTKITTPTTGPAGILNNGKKKGDLMKVARKNFMRK